LRLYNVATIAAVPAKDDYTAGFFVSKSPADDGVKKTHVYVLLE
jgi:hypothetical protein